MNIVLHIIAAILLFEGLRSIITNIGDGISYVWTKIQTAKAYGQYERDLLTERVTAIEKALKAKL